MMCVVDGVEALRYATVGIALLRTVRTTSSGVSSGTSNSGGETTSTTSTT